MTIRATRALYFSNTAHCVVHFTFTIGLTFVKATGQVSKLLPLASLFLCEGHRAIKYTFASCVSLRV